MHIRDIKGTNMETIRLYGMKPDGFPVCPFYVLYKAASWFEVVKIYKVSKFKAKVCESQLTFIDYFSMPNSTYKISRSLQLDFFKISN